MDCKKPTFKTEFIKVVTVTHLSHLQRDSDQHTSTLPTRVSCVPALQRTLWGGVTLVVFLRSNYLVLYTIVLVSFHLNRDVKLFCGTAILFWVCFWLRIHFVGCMWNTQQVGPCACHKVAVTRTTKLKLLFLSTWDSGSPHLRVQNWIMTQDLRLSRSSKKSQIGIFVEFGPNLDLWWHSKKSSDGCTKKKQLKPHGSCKSRPWLGQTEVYWPDCK